MSRVTVAALAAALIAVGPIGLTACTRDNTHDQRHVQTPEEVEVPEETESPQTDGDADGELALTLDVSAEEYSFEGIPETLPVGTTEITLENTGTMPHDLVLEELGDEVVIPETAPGEQATGTVSLLQRGEYTFYCSVGDHRERGMETTVTVE
ncbi:cupredoxin domain-containing protein [Nocardiopsis sp. NRRL B-16309]|uniref:cupredoxin domain-containing protein n=1 Tax=Nocardiopsis sp. NRRL B-16309 TaxID=1519494 RepID=UPI0006AE98CF|nr:cupredoxin domain-containing protein [Nocardiopsis sp. NRRL B-16309]